LGLFRFGQVLAIGQAIMNTATGISIDKNEYVEIRHKETKEIIKIKIGKLYNSEIKYNEYEVKAVNPLDIMDIQYKDLIDVVEHIIPGKRYFKVFTENNSIGVTEDHALFYCENGELKNKKGNEFKKGDKIAIIKDGVVYNDIVVHAYEYFIEDNKVYDLSVKDFQNFIVNGEIISHNTKTMAQWGWPLGLIGAAIIDTAGGLQIAQIAKQKPPKPPPAKVEPIQPAFAQGSFSVPSSGSATVHQGEIITPQPMAEAIRQGDAVLSAGAKATSPTINVAGNIIDTAQLLEITDGLRNERAADMGTDNYSFRGVYK